MGRSSIKKSKATRQLKLCRMSRANFNKSQSPRDSYQVPLGTTTPTQAISRQKAASASQVRTIALRTWHTRSLEDQMSILNKTLFLNQHWLASDSFLW